MKVKKIKLDSYEQDIENFLDSAKLKPTSKKDREMFKEAADTHLQKSKRISLRMSSSDLQRIKVKAIEKGMPYQTLIASVVHQYAYDKVKIQL